MTQDEIIEMARQAKLPNSDLYHGNLEAFAKLVAAAEREKVARWQIGSGYATGHGDTIEDLLVELEWQVREAEREACAKFIEDGYVRRFENPWREDLAAAIRARGEA